MAVFLFYFNLFQLAHFSLDKKHATNARCLANPNRRGRCHFPYDFWSSYAHLIPYQSEGFVLNKCSYRPLHLC